MYNQARSLLILVAIMVGCTSPPPEETNKEEKLGSITEEVITATIDSLKNINDDQADFRIEKGIGQAASFWSSDDGTADEFTAFCMKNFIASDEELEIVFNRISNALESMFGCYNKISVDLKLPLHVPLGQIYHVDEILGSYSPSAHFNDDMFANELAFIILLNFPFYDLEEKTAQGMDWDRKQWAYARMGELFVSRTPANINQDISTAVTEADSYISDYNIYMGNLRDNAGDQLFPQDLRLITHWGIRDELKSNYNTPDGLARQRMIYQVMLRIIRQEIPEKVIDNPNLLWNPFTNQVWENGQEVSMTPEPDTRYAFLLNNFHAMKEADPYNPFYPDYISRAFDEYMEIPRKDVESLFIQLVSSPEIKQVAELISKRLERPLEPFDIWYDGFKSRSSLNEEELDKITRKRYPDQNAFEKDLPNILIKLGFNRDSAKTIASRITVDAARGSGHAWGAEMKGDKARLRTRIGPQGMDYKGYNIAVHEFGHNVEQTISLYNMDYYILHGVPNTAFTEALAFLFQQRDLALLGMEKSDPRQKQLIVLDNLWSSYEIMGVSLVDMNVWQWMYDHPDATPQSLKEAVISIATEIWNKYYEPVFGIKDVPILAIYSHMIDNPLYLSNYPVGQLIQFQIEQYLEGKDLATEIYRMFSLGKLVPQVWMKKAVGEEISVEPVLEAVDEALNRVNKQ